MSVAPLGQHVNRTHCRHGHELTPDNIRIAKETGYWLCNQCHLEKGRRSQKKWRAKQGERGNAKANQLIEALQAIRNVLHAHNRPDKPLPNEMRVRCRDLADRALRAVGITP